MASGACGIVRGATPFLRDGPVYQKTADAGWSGCIGVGGDAQVRVRAGASALASALAAMLKDAADGDAGELPFAWPPQPGRKGCRHRQRGSGCNQRVGSRNQRGGGVVEYVINSLA